MVIAPDTSLQGSPASNSNLPSAACPEGTPDAESFTSTARVHLVSGPDSIRQEIEIPQIAPDLNPWHPGFVGSSSMQNVSLRSPQSQPSRSFVTPEIVISYQVKSPVQQSLQYNVQQQFS